MRSRQINFFIDKVDYEYIDDFVCNLNGCYIAFPLRNMELRLIKSLKERENGDWLKVFIYNKDDENNILVHSLKSKTNDSEVLYTIDELINNVIEFERCFFDDNQHKIRAGRIYFISEYYENNLIKRKDEAFIEFSNKCIQYLKKKLQLIKEGPFKGYYISTIILDKLAKSEIELIT